MLSPGEVLLLILKETGIGLLKKFIVYLNQAVLFVFDYIFVQEEYYSRMPKTAREIIKERYPTVFWDSLNIFDELGYSKIEIVEKSTWSNKDDESNLADLCRELNTELIFSCFIRYCTK